LLDLDQAREAYPLVRHKARVSIEQWIGFCAYLASCGGGVLAVRAETGQIHGVAAYLPTQSLKLGRALRVEVFVAFEMWPASAVRDHLLTALDDIAEQRACPNLMLNLDVRGLIDNKAPKVRDWQDNGLLPSSVEFVRSAGTAVGVIRSD
jgi:hypothetical protein